MISQLYRQMKPKIDANRRIPSFKKREYCARPTIFFINNKKTVRYTRAPEN
jgi:hypothetical protein